MVWQRVNYLAVALLSLSLVAIEGPLKKKMILLLSSRSLSPPYPLSRVFI